MVDIMPSRVMNNFNKLKAKGLTDEEAIKQSFGLVAKGRAKIRATDKKQALLRRSKKTKRTTKHNPAGLRYLRRKKAGV